MHDVAILTSAFEVGPLQKGMGYRYWELAQVLADRGLDVALVTPAPSIFRHPNVTIIDRSALRLNEIVALSGTFIFCLHENRPLVAKLSSAGRTLIYDSVLTPLEVTQFQKVLDLERADERLAHFNASLGTHTFFNRISDHFLVGTRREKLLKVGELLEARLIDPQRPDELAKRMLILPVCGFNSHSARLRRSLRTDGSILWNGGVWNHYDYSHLIGAVAAARAGGSRVKLKFLYRNKTKAYESIRARIAREKLQGIVEIPAPDERNPDTDEKQDTIRRARALVLLNEHTLLSEVVLPMRMREALLFEKPMIVSGFGVLGDFVSEHGIGIAVSNSTKSIVEAIEVMLKDGAAYARFRSNIRRVRSYFAFEAYAPKIASVIRSSR